MGTPNGTLYIRLSEESADKGKDTLVTAITTTSLAALFVAARLFTRGALVKKIGSDDWTCLVSLIFSLAFTGLLIGEWKLALGGHRSEISTEMFRKQVMLLWASVPMYNASLFCSKASISLQYHRIFPGSRIRIACYGVLIFLALYGLWVVLGSYLTCIPVKKFWDDRIEGHCMSRDALWLSSAIVHIVMDVILLVMPMPILIRLNLPKRQRIALVLVFALGGFVCITSGLRLKSLRKAASMEDITRDNAAAASWSTIECNVALICCSLPTLRPLVARIFPRLFSISNCDYGGDFKRNIPCLSRWFASQESRGQLDQEFAMQSYARKASDEEAGGDSSTDMGGITAPESVSKGAAPANCIDRGELIPPS